jgi:hypothetical protein
MVENLQREIRELRQQLQDGKSGRCEDCEDCQSDSKLGWAERIKNCVTGLPHGAATKMRSYALKLQAWYTERMAMYDTDESFRVKQDAKYGGRARFELSVADEAEGKIVWARAKAEAKVVAEAARVAEKEKAEAARVAAEEEAEAARIVAAEQEALRVEAEEANAPVGESPSSEPIARPVRELSSFSKPVGRPYGTTETDAREDF